MIEDNIRNLRRAARITNKDQEKEDNLWCVVAGNVQLIDDVAYMAIASNHRVNILFREHVILKEGNLDKKYDFIMLYGSYGKIDEIKRMTSQRGGSFIQIPRYYLSGEQNLMIFVAPDDTIRKSVGVIEKSKIPFAILQESQTTGFIDVNISDDVKLPGFIKSALKPFYKVNEVVLSTILISVEKDNDIEKVQGIATSNKIFVIDFKDIVTED